MYYMGFYDLFDHLLDDKKVAHEDAVSVSPPGLTTSKQPRRARTSWKPSLQGQCSSTGTVCGDDHVLEKTVTRVR